MQLHEWLEQAGHTQARLIDRMAAIDPRHRVTQGAVSQWLSGRVPAERVIIIERATGGAVTRHEMRPDLYPVEESHHAA